MTLTETEEWRIIPDWPGYEASSAGRVRRATFVLSIRVMETGYCTVKLRRSGDPKQHQRKVHRLVLEAFVGRRPDDMQCRHLDGDKTNNRIENLTWGTPAENVADQFRLGERPSHAGVRNGNAKLDPELVAEIRTSPESHAAIAARLSVHPSTISLVRNGRRWK